MHFVSSASPMGHPQQRSCPSKTCVRSTKTEKQVITLIPFQRNMGGGLTESVLSLIIEFWNNSHYMIFSFHIHGIVFHLFTSRFSSSFDFYKGLGLWMDFWVYNNSCFQCEVVFCLTSILSLAIFPKYLSLIISWIFKYKIILEKIIYYLLNVYNNYFILSYYFA